MPSNEFEDAAEAALAMDPNEKTLWDRVRQAMVENDCDPDNGYHVYRVSRHVGELLTERKGVEWKPSSSC